MENFDDLINKIVQGCCESEVAEPNHPDTISIDISDLYGVLRSCFEEAARAKPDVEPVMSTLDPSEIALLLTKSDLWDMHQHMGWYSAPEKNFKNYGANLVRDVERALSAKNKFKAVPADAHAAQAQTKGGA